MKFDEEIIRFGVDFEFIDFDPFDLIILPQVRKKKNASAELIAHSIEDRYLINLPDVVRLDFEEFKNHVNFISHLCGEKINYINYKPFIDGYYYVLAAGETRTNGIKLILINHGKKGTVKIKLHKVQTSEEILAIQLDENYHKEISAEERAVAIIGTYRLGIENGKWKDKAEFVKKNRGSGFSRDMLNDALVFADLPLEVQKYVFGDMIPYAVGVEVAKIFPLIRKYEADIVKSEELLESCISYHCGTLLFRLQQAKSIKNALEILSGHTTILNNHFRPKEAVQLEIFDLLADAPNRQAELHFQYLKNEHKKIIKGLTSMPFEYFVELLSLDTELTGCDHSFVIKSVKKLYIDYIDEYTSGSQLNLKKRK